MRAFIVVSHTVPLTADFSLDDLAGGAGRIDVLCRCATEAFLTSHRMRRDVQLHFSIQGELTVSLFGERLRYLNPDERSTAALLRAAIARGQHLAPTAEARSTPGITVRREGLAELLDRLKKSGFELMILDESGVFQRRAVFPAQPAFVLSDHLNFNEGELSLLDGLTRISVGPKILHGHQCITLVHNELDLREARWIGL